MEGVVFPLEDADREEQRNVRRSKALLLLLRCTQLREGYLILQGGDAIREDGKRGPKKL